MASLTTKTSSCIDGLVSGVSYQQNFNMNHICLQPYLVWLYSTSYRVITPKMMTRRGNKYLQYR